MVSLLLHGTCTAHWSALQRVSCCCGILIQLTGLYFSVVLVVKKQSVFQRFSCCFQRPSIFQRCSCSKETVRVLVVFLLLLESSPFSSDFAVASQHPIFQRCYRTKGVNKQFLLLLDNRQCSSVVLANVYIYFCSFCLQLTAENSVYSLHYQQVGYKLSISICLMNYSKDLQTQF